MLLQPLNPRNLATVLLLEQLVSDVSPEVKATLVKRLLGDGGLQVTFGQSHVNATNFYNIQSASTEQLSEIILEGV
jgi:hypothetical protein